MKKPLICCLFGNTANALARKMQSLADREGYTLMISAVGLDNFASVAPAFDGFLIAPQYKAASVLRPPLTRRSKRVDTRLSDLIKGVFQPGSEFN